MDLILKSSVGYYFDSELNGYVTSCKEKSVMKSLMMSFENPTTKLVNTWFMVRPSDYLVPILTSGMCYINIKPNTEDAWILGQNFMNQYEICFDLKNSRFSIDQPYALSKYIENNYQATTVPYIT
jgi:Eukaryotic aspartyl protease